MKDSIVEYWDHLVNSPFVIGAAGALTSMLAGKNIPFWRKFSMGVAGMLSAGFISPAICVWLGIDQVEYRSAFAFAVGMAGLQIAGGIIKLAEDIKQNPSKYLPEKWKK